MVCCPQTCRNFTSSRKARRRLAISKTKRGRIQAKEIFQGRFIRAYKWIMGRDDREQRRFLRDLRVWGDRVRIV